MRLAPGTFSFTRLFLPDVDALGFSSNASRSSFDLTRERRRRSEGDGISGADDPASEEVQVGSRVGAMRR